MAHGSSPDAGHQQAAGIEAVNHDFFFLPKVSTPHYVRLAPGASIQVNLFNYEMSLHGVRVRALVL